MKDRFRISRKVRQSFPATSKSKFLKTPAPFSVHYKRTMITSVLPTIEEFCRAAIRGPV
jgi:hypothetical protein